MGWGVIVCILRLAMGVVGAFERGVDGVGMRLTLRDVQMMF